MQQHFILQGRDLHEVEAGDGNIAVFSAPSEEERRILQDVYDIDEHTLNSALDPEEIARFEYDARGDATNIIWKRPDPRADADATRFEVASVGIFLRRDRVVIVAPDERPPISTEQPELDSQAELVLRVMRATVQEYVARLRAIKRTAGEIQGRLNRTIDNRELVRMFNVSEDLVYYVDAIDANGAVLTKLRNARSRLGFTEEDTELLDDLIIDNEQVSRQGHIYTAVLGGLLDARGNIVNNNMNVLIKNLTVVNVVFLPLGVLAGMGGMSEFSRFLDELGVDFHVGFFLFGAAMIAIGLTIFRLVQTWISRRMGGEAA
ncbi:MAG TPA: CorA family divalent cation transporter [Patescibacteria group bacterium]|nr:CorA family divalent cation transporter [Patescibacteria group bacterium]